MSGISTSLISLLVYGAPTCPHVGSLVQVIVAGAAVSVYPYPSWIWQQKATLRKFKTSFEIGADPVIITLTLPPNVSLNLLKTILSYIECVVYALFSRFVSFFWIPHSAIVLLWYGASDNFYFMTS